MNFIGECYANNIVLIDKSVITLKLKPYLWRNILESKAFFFEYLEKNWWNSQDSYSWSQIVGSNMS